MRMILALALLATTGGAAVPSGEWWLTPHGYGPVRIGMTRQQVERALGTPLRGEAIDDAAACIEMAPARGHRGLIFMFEHDHLTRISAGQRSSTRTPRAIGVGATEAAVRRAYPRGLQSEAHKYVGLPARYLTYWLNGARGVRFETDAQRRVQVIHAGTRSIEYVEGCA